MNADADLPPPAARRHGGANTHRTTILLIKDRPKSGEGEGSIHRWGHACSSRPSHCRIAALAAALQQREDRGRRFYTCGTYHDSSSDEAGSRGKRVETG